MKKIRFSEEQMSGALQRLGVATAKDIARDLGVNVQTLYSRGDTITLKRTCEARTRVESLVRPNGRRPCAAVSCGGNDDPRARLGLAAHPPVRKAALKFEKPPSKQKSNADAPSNSRSPP